MYLLDEPPAVLTVTETLPRTPGTLTTMLVSVHAPYELTLCLAALPLARPVRFVVVMRCGP
jgi:hypothetical protein